MPVASILSTLPVHLPVEKINEDVDVVGIARAFESRLGGLTIDDFTDDAIWRDIYAFTGTIRTFYGSSDILARWTELNNSPCIDNVKLDEGSPMVMRVEDISSRLDVRYSFEIQDEPVRICKAILSLVPGANGTWRIWMIRTILNQLKGYPNVDLLDSEENRWQNNGTMNGRIHGSDHFDCVVVGAGQAGLSVAGRLKAMKLSYVVLDKNENVGDNWKLRYESLRLHTTRNTSQLPFERTFTADRHGKFLTKNDLAQGYSEWAEKFGIHVWLGTSLNSGKWLQEEKIWQLEIIRADASQKITARHVVMATGAGGQIPKMPNYPGMDKFRGVVLHSSQFTSAKAWKGKAGIVIGTANTGHDVARDMVLAGCSSVTMVQRSPTYVFASEYFEPVQDALYNERIPIDMADMAYMTMPWGVSRLLSNHALHARTRKDSARWDALESTGFKLIRYGDIVHQLYECFGGHYMDVGAVDMMIDGRIKVKADALPVHFTSQGLVFGDSSEISADVIVFATGFEGNTRDLIQTIFGSSVSTQTTDFWGLDAEGEIRGFYKPSGREFKYADFGSDGGRADRDCRSWTLDGWSVSTVRGISTDNTRVPSRVRANVAPLLPPQKASSTWLIAGKLR